MNPSTNTRRRLLTAIALAVLATAIAAPLAQAQPGSTGKYGPLDPWAYRVIYLHQGRQHVVPEITAGLRASGSPGSTVASAPLPGGGPNGFAWGDAGIGAAVALGAVLLAAGTALALRKGGALAHIHL